MNLITPDFGLLFWMVVIFGLVFFLLAKFGFPIITRSVDDRSKKIEKSLKDADALAQRIATWKTEQEEMMAATRKEQSLILREAADTRERIVADAKAQAQAEADKILADARAEIAAEKEAAIREVRKEVALLSVEVAEKVLRRELSDRGSQRAYIDTLVDEADSVDLRS